MMKIESRSPIELDELPPWDDSDTPAAVGRHLTPYSFDSEQRTLVGMGPRRSRPVAAAPPDSQRMPMSEAPGPFIAEDEDEVPASLRRPKLGLRAIVMSAVLLVPLAAVGVVRGLSAPAQAPAETARAAASPVPQKAEAPAATEEPKAASAELEREAPVAPEALPALPRSAPIADKATRDVAPLSVNLPEVPPAPDVVDRSKDDVNAGLINVASTPPSKVVLDGRPLGMSPRQVKVPAGPHTLVFIHPLYGRRSLSVNVRAGATASAAAEF